jgi:glutamate dehydrogenase (NADP+)
MLWRDHDRERAPIATLEELDARIAGETARMFSEIKATANEFNARGDLRVATDIAGFLRVGNAMLSHGAV